MARLAARFWDTDQGRVLLGGVPETEIDPELLLENISFVFQDVVLFNDNVFANIRIGKKDATREEVLTAAKAANCDSFVSRLPDGYDTIIGENGSTLSGGERQRISIARAILKNAPVVILDEATAALDPENEVEIQAALSSLVRGKTTLVIAHRLRTVVDSDQIIVLDNGRVVECGKHETLMEQAGLYARMYNIQQKSLGWNVSSVK
ncbi:MAG: ABC transporter ATP-binding protein [Lachnospiraceae bacterium]